MSEPFDAEKHVRPHGRGDGARHRGGMACRPSSPTWRRPRRIAELVLAFPLDDHVEPAPVFEA